MKLICYLSNGYPTIESSIAMAENYIQAGCDIIEVDFPSSDPYLEGEYIANRMKEALEACNDYSKYMDGIIKIKSNHPDTKFILLSYENTILEIGVERFIKFCVDNDLMDLIYVGSHNEEVKSRLIENGIKISCYVQFHMDEKEIQSALLSNGFVYMQAKPTTNNINPEFPTLKHCIEHLKKLGIKREIYCGVGIYAPEDIQMAKDARADGVFVGSTVLKLHNDVPKMKETIALLKKTCND
ncbi:tryptophan synthase subunit alpha [Ruminiclostridium cellobioparum]|uniref:tryptophan synthase n=1 Tax=Ruminiclostridium cellobioparum subsp. termitidis CT1112 TaxID=1195236 RepID=S0FV76_RUMCE|nr:tryptophan synthase subunit alpha [Ruminiclostridium cellobioparum]EMS72433.1 tryptophan synthase, alpha subunit [Ruminiclostridium cellobioparum subsp. termitidis CT1112]